MHVQYVTLINKRHKSSYHKFFRSAESKTGFISKMKTNLHRKLPNKGSYMYIK